METKITLLEYPTEQDWMEVKRRALVTVGKNPVKEPTKEWMKKILEANHSPIRYLRFSFYLQDVPYWISVHLCRHTHAQPYVKTQRNDRQNDYDRNSAPQDSPVDMIWDINAEELITIAHKRLCTQAAVETRKLVKEMCELVEESNPEFKDLLVPLCIYRGGRCTEFNPCGYNKTYKEMGEE